MKKTNLFRLLLSLLVALPFTAWAQVDVNRKMYPDYSDELNPDWSMLETASGAKRANESTASTRPAYVNNAEKMYFPPVFNQDGGSCGSASRISYMFTYELNAYRNLNGKLPENYYPSHFVWLLTNGNSGKNEFVTSIGVPSAATYGGQTYSQYFGSQDCANDDFGWMQGYDKWFEAMHNRMLEPVNFPMNVGTEEGRELVKNWLWNHNGDESFGAGGVCGIGLASMGGNYEGKIPNTAANKAAGVVNKRYVAEWGTQVDHAMTIVGYDDRIEFDLDGDGVYGETDADEVGAWIIVNSWGEWWGNNGFIYCPYAYGGASFTMVNNKKVFSGNWWAPEIYKVRKDYRPLRTIKLEMEYSRRSEICLSAGVSTDLNAELPEKSITFEHFRYAGDGNYGNTNPAPEVPMLGRWADGKLHTEPMEFGYDLTDLTEGYDKSLPLKYFFIVDTKSWAQGNGIIHNASIIDYEHNRDGVETSFSIPHGGVEIKSAGRKTIISVVVYGEPYYAPQNLMLTSSILSWSKPLPSMHSVVGYKIYNDGVCIGEAAGDALSYDLNDNQPLGMYGIKAVYEGGVESQMITVSAPVASEWDNTALNLKYSGIRIPDVFSIKYEQATIEFSMKPNSLAAWNQSAGPGWGTFMMHADYNGSFTAGWDTSNRTATMASALKVDQWSHIAIVVDGSKMVIYVNGVPAASCTSSSYSGLGGFGDLVFNADVNSYNRSYTDATIDELRIWNVARTADDIKNSCNAQFAGKVLPKGLIAYFKGNTTKINGEVRWRDYVGGHHAYILNSNYATDYRTDILPTSKAELAVSINALDEQPSAGKLIKLSADYSDAVSDLSWTIDGLIENVTVREPSVVFPAAGDYKITLEGKSISGATVTDELVVTVLEEEPIDASFHAGGLAVIKGERTFFTVDNPLPGQLYEWSFPGADVESAQGIHASAVYAEGGVYDVTLKVISMTGKNEATKTLQIEVLDAAPEASFEVSPVVILKGERTVLKDISKYNPVEWEWIVENNSKKYVIIGQHSTLTPTECGVYDVTLKVHNDVGVSTTTRERALIVCNADSKNGLNFTGRDNAKVTAPLAGAASSMSALSVDWWMCPDALADNCLGIGDDASTFLLTTTSTGIMNMNVGGTTGKSQEGYVIEGEWHHYTAVFSDGFADFYRDGEYFSTSYISFNLAISNMASFAIGNDNAPMNGRIDELRVWKKALSVDEIAAVANAPIENPADYSDLILYYDFNQSGGAVIDRTANGNDGVRTGFGPDGDAWGLSKGVFCLESGAGAASGDVTSLYLSNYKAAFKYSTTLVNASIRNRFYTLTDWTIENAVKSGSVTTGAHVDAQKSYCMTFTTSWDGFNSKLTDHKVYQTIDLPVGNYTFTVNYHDTWEGQCDNSYVVVARGEGLPNTANVDQSIAYVAMKAKGSASSHVVEFTLKEPTTVSLGLLVNMNGRLCMNISSFMLERDNTEYIIADGGTTSVDELPFVPEREQDSSIYDLQGRKVTSPLKSGIYIMGGKKVMVK